MIHPRHSVYWGLAHILTTGMNATVALVLMPTEFWLLAIAALPMTALCTFLCHYHFERWFKWRKERVDNAVTRAGNALQPFIDAMNNMPKYRECSICGEVTTRSSGICHKCIRQLTKEDKP